MSINNEANKILDNIIEKRRTVRSFKTDIPGKEMIEAVIHAGLWAPYAGLAVTGDQDFRKFFVIQNGSPLLTKINQLLKHQSVISLEQMGKGFKENSFLREKSIRFLDRLSSIAENGFPELVNAPCLIIIAERKGIPPSEKQSLAHVVQNMWLKATVLGLGLRLISIIESLTENMDFCSLLGLKLGEFAFNGCMLGYADQESQAGKRPDDKEVTKWL